MLLLAAAHQARAAGVLDRDHEPLYDMGLLTSLEGVLHRLTGRGPSHALKGLAVDDAGLVASMEREVVFLQPGCGGWREVGRWSHPHLNDVHHALRHDDALWVASTGADAVLEVRGDRVRTHLLGAPLPTGDLRRRSLKPHAVHPNHLFVWRDRVWVTRLHQGDAVVVGEPEHRLFVDEERIHDGVVHDGRVWFTTVDGRVVAVDEAGGRQVLDLNDGSGPLGWCRGLAFHEGVLWVGFSRLRATRWRQHLAWVRGRLRGRVDMTRRPTRLVGVRLAGEHTLRGEVVHEVDLEALGVGAVFGVGVAAAFREWEGHRDCPHKCSSGPR